MTKGFEEILDGLSTEVALCHASYVPGKIEPGQIEEEVPPKRVSVTLQFCEKGFGFGEVTLVATPEGTFLDTECMSVERVKRYFALLLDGAIRGGSESHPIAQAVRGLGALSREARR